MINLHPELKLNNHIYKRGADLLILIKNQAKTDYILVEKLLNSFVKNTNRSSYEFWETLDFLFMIELIVIEGYKIKINDNNK